MGKNNRNIFSTYTRYLREICPSLNYHSQYVNVTKLICNIREGLKKNYNNQHLIRRFKQLRLNYDIKKQIHTLENRKIRVGFISAFLNKNHSVTKDRSGIIMNLPRDKYEVSIFIFDKIGIKPTFRSTKEICSISEKLYNTCKNEFIILKSSSLEESKKIIEDKHLDILVYCEIGMNPICYYLSFLKLAPIQLNTWGHSDTSGNSSIDYYISSKYFELDNYQEAQSHYSEKLILLDSLCTYYYNPEQITHFKKTDKMSRKELGIPEKKTIYICLQSLFKLQPEFDKVFISIIENDPNAVILLLNTMVKSDYSKKMFIKRITNKLKNKKKIHKFYFITKKPMRIFLEYIRNCDVMLDPFPFGGCNTSFEGFFLGKPIVTMPSKFINGRFTHGLYKKMGISNLITHTYKDYINIALKCGKDKKYRSSISKKILQKQNLIFNEKKSIDDWDNMLQKMFNEYYYI